MPWTDGPGVRSLEKRDSRFVNYTTDTFFEIFAKDQLRLKRYGMAMAANAASEGYHVKHVVENYPWDSLGEATVVDVFPPGCLLKLLAS